MSACQFAAIGWVITLIGMLVSNIQTNQRITRAELRAKLDKLGQELNNLLSASSSYYLDEDAKLSLQAISIHSALNVCSRILYELKPRINLENDLSNIFELVTGGSFESADHKPGNEHIDLCKRISLQNQELLRSIEYWYQTNYPK